MATIEISELPAEPNPVASSFVAIDNGTTRKTTLTQLGNVAIPLASEAEARAGINSTKRMSPLTTAQAIDELAVKPGDLGTAAYQNAEAFAGSVQNVVPVFFDTMALAMAYVPIAAPNLINLRGYFLGDGAEALYKKVGSEPTHPGKFSVTQVNATVVWYELTMAQVSPQMFGAVANATNIGVGTDDTAAIEKWKLYLLAKPLTAGILRGTYRYNPAVAWDVSGRNDGYNISGRAKNGDGFYLDSGKTLAIEGANSFYHHFDDFHVRANVSGPAVRIGKDDFSDAFNGSSFTLVVNNDSLNDLAEGIRFNYVLASKVFVVSNCGGTGRPGEATSPGHGKAIVLRQACFNDFILVGGQANIGLYMTVGTIFANTFSACDFEEVSVAVQCDSANASGNMFLSGQILGTTSLSFTAGNFNIFDAGCNLVNYGGGSLGANLVGVEIRKPAPRAYIADPAIPATTVYYKNTTGSRYLVNVYAGVVSLISVRATDGGVKSINQQVVGECVTVMLPPNWEIALTYTSAPAWRWFPA